MALLTGRREFWSLPLRVTLDVLVPRPETETLVAAALDARPGPRCRARVLDVGTGSGAIALAIARERPKARVTATDVSPGGARRRRRQRRGARRSPIACASSRGRSSQPVAGERFDLVVSNPPYVAERDACDAARPSSRTSRRARSSPAPDGTDVLRAFAAQVRRRRSRPGGRSSSRLDPAPGAAVSRVARGGRPRRVDRTSRRCAAARASSPRGAARLRGERMDRIVVRGGRRLAGEVQASGSKNATLALMAAALLTDGETVLRNVPRVRDVATMMKILEALGVRCDVGPGRRPRAAHPGRHGLASPRRPTTWCARCAPRSWCSARWSRATAAAGSRCRAAARSARARSTSTSRARGARREDRASSTATSRPSRGSACAARASPSTCSTVTGTENVMMAAALAEGRTVIENAAREPEVATWPSAATRWARGSRGAGTRRIEIEGVERARRRRARRHPRPHRGRHLLAAGRDDRRRRARARAPRRTTSTPCSRSCARPAPRGRRRRGDAIRAARRRAPRGRRRAPRPIPGFPTDMQAQFMALMTWPTASQRDHRDDLREPLHARARAAAHGRRHPPRRADAALVRGARAALAAPR